MVAFGFAPYPNRVYYESMTKENEGKKLPDTTQAEKWLDSDHFLFEGNVYIVLSNGTVQAILGGREAGG